MVILIGVQSMEMQHGNLIHPRLLEVMEHKQMFLMIVKLVMVVKHVNGQPIQKAHMIQLKMGYWYSRRNSTLGLTPTWSSFTISPTYAWFAWSPMGHTPSPNSFFYFIFKTNNFPNHLNFWVLVFK